ncbi:MAG: S49 family peptidase [bacterium]|nr:S49 family peptidase [bacterium]
MRLLRYLFSICLITVSSLAAQGMERIPIPGDVFYFQPASTVFGAEAAWANPAALGRFNATTSQAMADYYDGKFASDWGWVMTAQQLALAWRKIDNPTGDFKEWVFAAGLPVGSGSAVGFSYRYFSDGPALYDNRHFWNAGLVTQGVGPYAFGAVFSNLNRGKIAGERTEIEMQLSAAYRPFGDKLTLSADAFLSTQTRFSNADWLYHAEYSPIRGLFINGSLDSDRNFEVGFRVNFDKSFLGNRSGFDRNSKHRGTTSFVGFTEQSQPSITNVRGRRLVAGLGGSQPENPPKPVFGRKRLSFTEILTSIYRAADDRSINEMVVTLHEGSPGFARAQELRNAFDYFRSRGKRLICYLTDPSNLTYYIASAADSIFIPPVSQLNLVGLRAELTFYAGTLEKLGVKVDMVRIGDYKSAVEPWTQTASSEQNRAQVNRLLDELYDQFVSDIATSRGLTADSVKRIVDNGPFTSADARTFGLVDGLCYRDDLDSCIGKSRAVPFAQYVADTLINYSWDRHPVLAVVVAQGEITADNGDGNPLSSSTGVTPSPFRRAFAAARRDRDVAGIVFRIDSPGGSALASDDIYHTSQKAANQKPMVVSMANVTASGGYYLAMPGRKLFALPGTVTGSIGIFGGKLDLSNLYEKISLGKELYLRGKYSGMLSTVAPFSAEEREKYYSQIEAFYGHFCELVASSRHLSVDSVDQLGRGKVWTGREALRNGLVDQLGGLKQSLDYLAATLELKEYRVRVYPENRPLFVLPARSFMGMVASVFGGDTTDALGQAGQAISSANGDLYARMPYDLLIE